MIVSLSRKRRCRKEKDGQKHTIKFTYPFSRRCNIFPFLNNCLKIGRAAPYFENAGLMGCSDVWNIKLLVYCVRLSYRYKHHDSAVNWRRREGVIGILYTVNLIQSITCEWISWQNDQWTLRQLFKFFFQVTYNYKLLCF